MIVASEEESRVEVIDFLPRTSLSAPGLLERHFPWDAVVLIERFL